MTRIGYSFVTALAIAACLLQEPTLASPVSLEKFLATRQVIEIPQNTSTVLKRNWYRLLLIRCKIYNLTDSCGKSAYWGWYPDDGNPLYGSQGTLQTLEQLNAAVGTPAFAVGAYAHIDQDFYNPLDPSTYFNGSEILPFIEQALLANATFVASISVWPGLGQTRLC